MTGRALILPPLPSPAAHQAAGGRPGALRRNEKDAERFATVAHAGQLDKAGRPYTGHLWRVARRTAVQFPSGPRWTFWDMDDALQMAWLHDAIEDTDTTADDLRAEGFAEAVVAGVLWLSKPPRPVPYGDWISSLAEFAPLPVLIVKLADVQDNSDPERLALLQADTHARLTRKYAGAVELLERAIAAKAAK